jgi:hypothetical protein
MNAMAKPCTEAIGNGVAPHGAELGPARTAKGNHTGEIETISALCMSDGHRGPSTLSCFRIAEPNGAQAGAAIGSRRRARAVHSPPQSASLIGRAPLVRFAPKYPRCARKTDSTYSRLPSATPSLK